MIIPAIPCGTAVCGKGDATVHEHSRLALERAGQVEKSECVQADQRLQFPNCVLDTTAEIAMGSTSLLSKDSRCFSTQTVGCSFHKGLQNTDEVTISYPIL
jgi:hypothetical protein